MVRHHDCPTEEFEASKGAVENLLAGHDGTIL